jgi:ABC-type oligopeptide transport system substrate-binding subunit
MRPVSRLIGALLLLAMPLFGAAAWAAGPAPSGQGTWAVHFTLARRWLDPGESEGSITPVLTFHAVHDALLKPMPAGPSAPSLAESWTVSPDGLASDFMLRGNARFQRLLADRAIFAPVWENGFNRGAGPRVEKPALTLIPSFPYAAPYEDVRLRTS